MSLQVRNSPSGLPLVVQPESYPIQSAVGLDGLSPRTLTLLAAGHEPGQYIAYVFRMRRAPGGAGTLSMTTTLSWSSRGQLVTSATPFGIGGGTTDLLATPSTIVQMESDGTVAITLAITFTGTLVPTANLDVRSWVTPVV